MAVVVLRRLVSVVPLFAVVSVVVFLMVHMVPGDPAVLVAGDFASPEQIAAAREMLGLNDPLWLQYWNWLLAALQGDLGASFLPSSQSVTEALAARVPVTASLIGGGIVVALVLGLPAGIVSARFRDTWIDRATLLTATIGYVVPGFVFAIIVVSVVSIRLGLLPATGYVSPAVDPVAWMRHLILPSLAVGIGIFAFVANQCRASLIEALGQPYVRTATAKGLLPQQVLIKHALRNAAVPVVTSVGLQIAFAIGGSVLIEVVFGLPGLGSLAVSAIQQRDFPMIQGVVLVSCIWVVVVNLLVDIVHMALDPKVRTA
ncbi:ABC transporter permease [Georgenia ruanii]|nr:ABC transporter permease [Georgenia ruanii]